MTIVFSISILEAHSNHRLEESSSTTTFILMLRFLIGTSERSNFVGDSVQRSRTLRRLITRVLPLFDLIPLETIVRLCKDREIRKPYISHSLLFSLSRIFFFVRFFEYI